MNGILHFLSHYEALLLFVVVFVEQLGLPLPSIPFLLAAGALAGASATDGLAALASATLAAVLADSIWFHLGRAHGGGVLKLLCRISLEPDSCVRRTEDLFVRHGLRGLITGKFIPGLGLVMPPLAGVFKVRFRRFLIYDSVGSLLYAGACLLLGFLFRNQLQHALLALSRLGGGAMVLLALLLAAYLAFKYLQRQRALRQMRMARITPEELRQKLQAGDDLMIVDLRSRAAVASDPFLLPGARHLLVDQIERWQHEVPRDRDVILYCSCPNEATAARTALILHRRGITRVRPLLGGIDGWRRRNYPMSPMPIATIPVEAGPERRADQAQPRHLQAGTRP
jgi:membrane protein DedA with SNARE-associated domain/rhodanese-related sulfurtransferase